MRQLYFTALAALCSCVSFYLEAIGSNRAYVLTSDQKLWVIDQDDPTATGLEKYVVVLLLIPN